MIRVYNLRKEQLPETKECRIICDIDCNFSKAKQLWVSVPEEYGDWLTDDVYDAFMIAMLYPAMYYKENITVEGCVSIWYWPNARNSPCDDTTRTQSPSSGWTSLPNSSSIL